MVTASCAAQTEEVSYRPARGAWVYFPVIHSIIYLKDETYSSFFNIFAFTKNFLSLDKAQVQDALSPTRILIANSY